MKTLRITTLFFALLLFSAALFAQSETRNVSSFDKIQVAGAFDVYLEKGDKESVKVDPGNVDPEKIITEIDGNTLKVYQEKGNYKIMNAKVYITYKSLDQIDRAGSGNLYGKSDLEAEDFTINTSGSGNLSLEGNLKGQEVELNASGSGNCKLESVEATDFEMNLAGSGNITVSSGTTQKQEANVAGSGNISAYGVKSDVCEVSITGSGDVEVYANESLEGSIAGSGNINYKGNAQVKKDGIIGSGEISKH
ncbi:MAG TPA: head GIN domain-containing protein [Cytophagales bacterium]|nr:head GIN domain-containing protein [Cytophagales bacterium]